MAFAAQKLGRRVDRAVVAARHGLRDSFVTVDSFEVLMARLAAVPRRLGTGARNDRLSVRYNYLA